MAVRKSAASAAKRAVRKTSAPAQPAPVVTGYDPGFLGARIRVPSLVASKASDAVTLDNSPVIHYTHFSLTMSKLRRFCHWVAWNIDGARLRKESRSGLPFILDPRIPAKHQVGNDLYSNNRLDRGHLARRADLLWGDADEAKKANKDSFFYTNITPQMDDFNQSAQRGVWGRLEDAIFDDVEVEDLRVSVFGGPVFKEDDKLFRSIRIPRDFWKVIAFRHNGTLKARGFVLTQNLNPLDALDLDEFRVFQVTLPEIESRTAVRFPAELKKAAALGTNGFMSQMDASARTPIATPAEIIW